MNSLDAAVERGWDQPTPSLAIFVQEVMDLVEAFLIHQEPAAKQVSPVAQEAFSGQRRIVSADGDRGIDDAHRRTLAALERAHDRRRHETLPLLIDRLESAESDEASVLEVDTGRTAPQLDEVGLAGDDAAAKLSGWHGGLRDFLMNKGRAALKYVLEWANILLGSMAAAGFLRPLAEPIKELKDVVHTML